MKKHFLTMLVFLTFLSSCGGLIKKGSGESLASPGENRGEILASSADAISQTESGKVAGYVEDGIFIFKGIPYAEAERFMPPVKPTPWQGVRSSRAYGPTCPQGKRAGWNFDEQAFTSDWDDGHAGEDCLRLNVWTKGLKDGKKRPVMVWIHGGGFAAGSSQEQPAYDGANLCQKGDVVMVSLNHRLNVLGFLDLSAFGGKYDQSGNVGMLDIVAALQWVRNNISEFGGDPDNVTIFGQSGGGGKVTNLMCMPSAKGLFHKAIVQSGSILEDMEPKYSRRIGAAVMEELGLSPSEIGKLNDIPYEQLLAAGEKAIAKVKREAVEDGFNIFLFGWAPTIDGDVLPCQPFSGQTSAISGNIPMLIGTTLHEFLGGSWNPALKNADLKTAKTELTKRYGDKADDFLSAFEKAYPKYKPIDLFDVDARFRVGAVKQANLKYAQQAAPVYMYLFTWESPVLDGMLRSSHCMELPFVFDNIYRARTMTGGGKDAYVLADKMSQAWLNFAATGNPNTKDLPKWDAYNPEKGATMVFNNQCDIWYNHDRALLDVVTNLQ